jgi:hypothetical protein
MHNQNAAQVLGCRDLRLPNRLWQRNYSSLRRGSASGWTKISRSVQLEGEKNREEEP